MLGSHQYKKIAKAADSCDNAWSLALGLSLYKMEKISTSKILVQCRLCLPSESGKTPLTLLIHA